MNIELLPSITFAFVTTFTPGPNNVSSAAMGVLHGYRKSFNYLLGITTGFFFMMLLSAWVASSILTLFPRLQSWLQYIGAGYILYLAVATLKASYNVDTGEAKPLGFINGLLLQVLNPKLIVYGLTLFSTFLAPIVPDPKLLLLAALCLDFLSFCSISLWTLFGAAIARYLGQPRMRLAVNAILALFLVYSALEMVGGV